MKLADDIRRVSLVLNQKSESYCHLPRIYLRKMF